MINFYQKCISPYLPPSCRFTPTCSNYSKEAFMKYNFFKALYLTIKRILKCNPFHPGGYDPLV
ncbi:MAG: membrane protein insertion efficiency factor YidD [Candidatus Cloacimonetes bacterium]|nr:membrane protein insertion efficiency factor YidD [Candidatus Cloacimonadota bacterium]